MSKPSLILVPGAWHTAEIWTKVIHLLEPQYRCVAVNLPSAKSDPTGTLLQDIQTVRAAIVAETEQGRDVIVVVHSYGGAVGCSAIKGLTRPEEVKSPGHVIGLASMASGFGPSGISFIEGAGGKPPPSWRIDLESGFALFNVDPRELFYHDLPVEEGNYWVSRLEKQSLKALLEGGEHAYAGWMDVPVWYLATADDRALPVQVQKMMVDMARDAGANISLREVTSSHSPMLSKSEDTARFITEAIVHMSGS